MGEFVLRHMVWHWLIWWTDPQGRSYLWPVWKASQEHDGKQAFSLGAAGGTLQLCDLEICCKWMLLVWEIIRISPEAHIKKHIPLCYVGCIEYIFFRSYFCAFFPQFLFNLQNVSWYGFANKICGGLPSGERKYYLPNPKLVLIFLYHCPKICFGVCVL